MVLHELSTTAVGSLGALPMERAPKPQHQGIGMLDRTHRFVFLRKARTKPILPHLPAAEPENGQDSLSSLEKQSLQLCAKTGVSQIPVSERFWSPQAKLKQRGSRSARPSCRIKATVSANKTLAPARRASRGGEPACSCCSPAGHSTVPRSQRQDQAHVL